MVGTIGSLGSVRRIDARRSELPRRDLGKLALARIERRSRAAAAAAVLDCPCLSGRYGFRSGGTAASRSGPSSAPASTSRATESGNDADVDQNRHDPRLALVLAVEAPHARDLDRLGGHFQRRKLGRIDRLFDALNNGLEPRRVERRRRQQMRQFVASGFSVMCRRCLLALRGHFVLPACYTTTW